MADYVCFVRNYLTSTYGNFEPLVRVQRPPIDFATSLRKARESTVAQLRERPGLDVVADNFRVTVAYLVLQLHARAPAAFWAETPRDQLFAYVYFCAMDQYADVLTHAEPVPGFSAVAALELLSSLATVGAAHAAFCDLYALARAQRDGRPAAWRPTPVDCTALLAAHADAMLRRRVARTLRTAAAAAAVVAAVAWTAWRVVRRW